MCVLCGVSGGTTFIPGIHTLPVGIFTALSCTTAGVLGKASAEYALWAHDPPDPGFTTITRPVTPRLPAIRTSRRLSRRAATALKALLRNISTEGSLIRAMTQAFERSQGALQAGDTVWEAKQRAAASAYAAKLVRVIRGRAKLRRRGRAALRASRFPTLAMSRTVVMQTLRQIRRHGFPKRVRRVFATVGLTATEQARLQATVGRLAARQVNLRPFDAILSSRGLTKGEQASADAFQRLAGAG
jgi:hypothetical protein